jgi:RecA/RadA recombinase
MADPKGPVAEKPPQKPTKGENSPAAAAKALKPKKDKKADLNETILKRLRAGAPRNKDAGTYEVAMTDKEILSRIKFTLDLGVDPFDDLIGGLPFGRLCEIFGLESCGKSQLVIRAAGRAALKHIRCIEHDRIGKRVDPKKVYVHVLYVDNEQSIDKDEKIVIDGVQIQVHLARCDTVEQLFKMADISITSVKEAQAKDKDTIYFILIVTDTIAAVASKEEMTQEWGKVDYSRQPKSIREGFRILQRDLSRVNVCWVCTNQVGDNMKKATGGGRTVRYSTPQADDFNSPGGRALKFYATHRIFMFKVRDYKLFPKSKFPSGMVIGFRSEKNRVLKPKREGRMVLLYGDKDGKGGGFDNLYSKLETMAFMGAVKRGESGVGLSFRFSQFGVEPTTFSPDEVEKSLDESDDEQGTEEEDSGKDPRIRYNGDFPKFYQAHKADIDALYAACIQYAFAEEVAPDGDDDEEGSDILGEEEA